jgi:hypothetical protein
MLVSDLLLEVRASRSLSADQVSRLERQVFGAGKPTREQLDLLFLVDTYLQRADPTWALLLSRAALSALVGDCVDAKPASPGGNARMLDLEQKARAA